MKHENRIIFIPPFVYDNLDNLHSLRLQAHLSIDELADKIGCSKSTLNLYERAQVKPSKAIYNKLANFFHWRLFDD